jgi:hypothetical protein
MGVQIGAGFSYCYLGDIGMTGRVSATFLESNIMAAMQKCVIH